MDFTEKQELIQSYLDAYNRFDIDAMLDLLSDDVRFENVQNNEVNATANGKAEFKNLAEQGKALFAEREQTILEIKDSPEMTSVKISYYGKLAADLPNGMKAGDELNLKGLSEFMFSNNKICSIRDIS